MEDAGNNRDEPRNGSETPSTNPTPTEKFDLASFRKPQDFAGTPPTRKLLTKIPVRKPANHWFVRTHPNPDFRFSAGVIDLKEDQETYLVKADLHPHLDEEPTFRFKLLVPATNRQGVLFLWPIGLPGPDGRTNDWNESAFEAAERAKEKWIRVCANMSLGAYQMTEATIELPEPEWPGLSFEEIIETAFRGSTIADMQHSVLRRLRGEL